jgi:hypothetical protein
MVLLPVSYEDRVQFYVLIHEATDDKMIDFILNVEEELEWSDDEYDARDLRRELQDRGLVCVDETQSHYHMLP